MNQDVKVYGTNRCEDTQATRSALDSLGVPYEYIDIEIDPDGAAWVKQQNQGKQKTPTVDVKGRVLSVPDEEELEDALRGTGLMI